MFSLRKSAAGIVAAAALAPLGLIGPANPAAAQTSQTVPTCDVRPRGTTFVTKAKTIDFDVPSARYFTFDLPEVGVYVYDTSVDGDGSSITVDPRFLKNADARWHTGTVERTRNDGTNDTCIGTWRLKRGTRVEITRVSKIKYGRKVTGTLERVNWGKNPSSRWTTYSDQDVNIEFVNARGKWQLAGQAPVRNGKFTFTKQIGERKWRAYFQGTTISSADYSSEVTG
ncbi:hypothetical protein [Kineosporia succinea]|uniref:Polysaccharide lyase-like protein n=1 Tax=Kineosporia succinea TaxID=84632 RepID=A0ABT9P3C4_9ACTN|nr:hypothetical protein [Kineosporia succinea]MDP9826695.1 hypothetical protein [Kineosporia succinea]